ncbi:MAG: universal stress protein [Desulfobacterales bacterium]|nr:universal stress protein [Desulfobacterales bacterium]
MLPWRKILCPTDFSDPSFDALRAARELALQSNAEIILLHVVSPVPIAPPGGVQALDTAAYLEQMLTYARESMDRAAGEMRLPDTLRIKKLVLTGNPGEEIAVTAEKEEVDLIVIATHGLTGWRRFISGSVAEKVVRLSPCPVLTIPAPPPEKEA